MQTNNSRRPSAEGRSPYSGSGGGKPQSGRTGFNRDRHSGGTGTNRPFSGGRAGGNRFGGSRPAGGYRGGSRAG